MLLNKSVHSITRVALAEQSLACPVRAQTVLRFFFVAKVVARRATRERDSVHEATERLRQLKIKNLVLGSLQHD